jgi:hypothetical protein
LKVIFQYFPTSSRLLIPATGGSGGAAALPTIHEQFDEAGLAFVYRSVYPSGGAVDVAALPAVELTR